MANNANAFAVAVGSSQTALKRMEPQPHTNGLQYPQQTVTPDAVYRDGEPFARLRFNAVDGPTLDKLYAAFGLTSADYAAVTVSLPTNKGAIRILGEDDAGQIKWNDTSITQLSTNKLQINLGTTIIKEDSSGKLEINLNSKQMVYTNMLTSTTVGAAGAASALPATPSFYERVLVGGVEYKRPLYAA